MAPDTKTHGSLEQHLMQALKYAGLDKQNLAELVKITLELEAKGVRPVKVFPIGIPDPDGIEVHSTLDARALQSLLGSLQGLGRISHIRIFPNGIPTVDRFATEIGIR